MITSLTAKTGIFTLLTVLSVFPAYSRQYDSFFPPAQIIRETPFELKGVSKLTVGYVFDVYVAAFYQLPENGPGDALTDTPHHLEIHYLRNISKGDFIKAAEDMLSRQYSPAEIAGIRERISSINQLYNDVRKGDRYSLTYLPGRGTELSFNGESKGVIPGADFARIYLGIWLGEHNPYRTFRDRLVGLP